MTNRKDDNCTICGLPCSSFKMSWNGKPCHLSCATEAIKQENDSKKKDQPNTASSSPPA